MSDHGHDQVATLTLADYGWSEHFARAEEDLNRRDPRILEDTAPARVMAVHRDALDVAGPEFCGRIHQNPSHTTDEARPTTGDWVALTRATHKIATVYPRTSLFKRRSAGSAVRTQLIAANVDTVMFVTSANQDFNVARLERYLALAQEAAVTPVIVITKVDLVDDAQVYVEQARAIRRDLAVVTIDARDRAILEQLGPWLGKGRTVALMGSSGVGKSTIVNSMMGGTVQATQDIREDDARGRHTTSGRSLHRMVTGAWLMDTPGMRELQIVDAASGIEAVFDDVAELTRQCRFSNCSHGSEPGCAIRAAIESGTLDPDRLLRFQKLQREERQTTSRVQGAHASNRGGFGKLARRMTAEKLNPSED